MDQQETIGNSLKFIQLARMNKVCLVYVSSCSNTTSIRDDLYNLELLELSSMKKVSLVYVSSCIVILDQ